MDRAFNTMMFASEVWTQSDSNPDLRFECPVVRRPWDTDAVFLRDESEIDSSPVIRKARKGVFERLLDQTVYPCFREQMKSTTNVDKYGGYQFGDVTTRVHVVFVPAASAC